MSAHAVASLCWFAKCKLMSLGGTWRGLSALPVSLQMVPGWVGCGSAGEQEGSAEGLGQAGSVC